MNKSVSVTVKKILIKFRVCTCACSRFIGNVKCGKNQKSTESFLSFLIPSESHKIKFYHDYESKESYCIAHYKTH